jgi:hypothetical protein
LREGSFLDAVLPFRALATLTTPKKQSSQYLEDYYDRYIQALQKHHGKTLGSVRSIERHPQPHIHAGLVCAIPLDCEIAEEIWRTIVVSRYSDSAQVLPYEDGLCGIGYVLKRLDSAFEDIRFSANIADFALTGGESHFPTSPAERRQQRRIRAQLERAST